MLCAPNLCQDAGKDHLSMDSKYDNHSSINFSFCQGLNKVDSSNDMLDKVILTKDVKRPTKKQRGVGPHKLILKKNKNRGNYAKKQEIQECE